MHLQISIDCGTQLLLLWLRWLLCSLCYDEIGYVHYVMMRLAMFVMTKSTVVAHRSCVLSIVVWGLWVFCACREGAVQGLGWISDKGRNGCQDFLRIWQGRRLVEFYETYDWGQRNYLALHVAITKVQPQLQAPVMHGHVTPSCW